MKKKYIPMTQAMFISTMLRCLAIIMVVIVVSLGVGMAGYHYFEKMEWIDAFHNAAQILGGMGEIGPVNSFNGKLFSGIYAIYCGLVLLASMGLLFAPIMHRVMHKFHIQDEN